MIFYLRLFFVFLWLVVSCVYGLILCVVSWGSLDLNRRFGHFFAWGVLKICGFKLDVEGIEHLESLQPCIYVANHQSGMDMAVFGQIYPHRTVVVGKKELKWIPFFGLFFVAAGNIILNREKRVSAIAGLAAAARQIHDRKVSVFIFPEGTRNRTDEPMIGFKKGAFYMAIQAGVPIVPIVCAPLESRISWQKKGIWPGKVRVKVLPPMPTSGYSPKEVDKLTHEVRGKMLEAILSLSDPSSMTHPVNQGR